MLFREAKLAGFIAGIVNNFLLITVLAMCVVSDSYGLELKGTTRASAMVSDNINRQSTNLEQTGSLLTQGFGVQLSETKGRRSFNLSLNGGWESLEVESNSSSEEIYKLDMNINLPWSPTGYVDVRVGTSRETTTPEADDPDQKRELVKRFDTGLMIAGEPSMVTIWQMETNGRMVQSVSSDLTETTAGFRWARNLNPVNTLSLRGSNIKGHDDIEMSSWQTMESSVVLDNRLHQNISRSYRLSWQKAVVEDVNGAEDRSEKIGFSYRWMSEKSSGLSYEASFGIDHLKTPSNEEIAEPYAEVAVSGPLSRTITTDNSAGYSLQTQDPLDTDIEWSRQGRLTAGINWTMSRSTSIQPRVTYIFEDINGENIPGRKDQTVVLGVNTRWTIEGSWIVNLGAVFENRESTEHLNELAEKRLELSVMNTF